MINTLFSIPFYRTNIGVHEVNVDRYCPDRKAWDGEMPTTFLNDYTVLHDLPEVESIIQWHLHAFVTGWTNLQGVLPRIVASWINIGGEGDMQYEHDHRGKASDLAGVYYLSVPKESEEVRFVNPTTDFRYVHHEANFWEMNPDTQPVVGYAPQAGELILFPSFIRHKVMPNRSTEPRISISFNAWIDYDESAFEDGTDGK